MKEHQLMPVARPHVVAFDIIETTFSLAALRLA
jgi:hypothetical protein